MAEANEQDSRRKGYEEFAARKPGLTVLTDHALRPEQGYLDNFNLRYRLGPVYDIVRYPETRTPMAIAVYGDWGTGKTTAMKWLHGLIDQWNAGGKAQKKINIRPVWFYPWKYDKKEDVWRGLVAEVILHAMNREANTKGVIEGFKTAAMFIGKSALDIASAAELQFGPVKLSGECLKQIRENLKDAVYPEKQYLQPYEQIIRDWIAKSLTRNERMVIFIDDLDRCMPEIGLQVLEALKLYLNIEKLIFVVGVDKNVVDKLVKEHYKGLGLDEDKSKNYLAKMFQVEVQVEPSEQQISDFLDEQLKDVAYWKEPDLSPDEQGLFRGLIFKLAERNPREVKRLINSALMTGAGAMMVESAPDSHGQIGFNQGLQLFFVRKILDDRYTMASEASSRRGRDFFQQWSQIVCAGREKDKDFPCSIKVPSDLAKIPPEEPREAEYVFEARGMKVLRRGKRLWTEQDLSFAPQEYHSLLLNPTFLGLLHLLADEDLGRLMQIPYPAEVAEITAAAAPRRAADIIREAIARQLKKKPDELADEDYGNIKELILKGAEICDLEPLKGLSSLRELNLSGTQVTNVEPLKGLTSLQWLNLTGTPVSNLEPVKGLTSLQWLGLGHTQVSNLEPLKALSSLQLLILVGTQVSDLEPIKGLTALQRVFLTGTEVSDLEPLRGLTNLQLLDLSRTQVSDLEPLKALTSLQWLGLTGTQVSDVEALKALTSLQELDLSGTAVSGLEPLKGLTSLQRLDLTLATASDLEPLKGLTSLQELSLSGTEVSDLEPIRGLTSLQWLDLRGTPVNQEQVAELREALPKLKIRR